jgi:hypothetical protein
MGVLLVAAALATAGWSVYVCIVLLSETCSAHAELEYISTRIARCLDASAAEVWSLVYCVEFQILLLLSVCRRLLSSYHFVTAMRPWIISVGVCFVVNFALVVEFRNDRSALMRRVLGMQFKEAYLHVYAVVVTMTSLTVLHALLCWSLLAMRAFEVRLTLSMHRPSIPACVDWYLAVDFRFRRKAAQGSENAEHGKQAAPQTPQTPQTPQAWASGWAQYHDTLIRYAELDWVYFMCIIVFFVTWFLNNNSGQLYSTAVHSEWIMLLLAALMHGYALWKSERPLSWLPEEPDSIVADTLCSVRAAVGCLLSCRDVGLCVIFVVSISYTLLILAFAPLAASEASFADPEHCHSSPMLLLAVLSTYAYGTLLLMA